MTRSQLSDAGSEEQQSQIVTDAAMETLLDDIRKLLDVDTAAILLLDESEQFLVATAARGIEEEVRQGVRVRAGLGFAGRIAAERRPVIIDRVATSNVVNPLLLRRGIVSMLGVPLMSDGQLLGVLHVGVLHARQFVNEDVATLTRAGERVADVIVRHRSFVDRTAARALQNSLAPRLPDIPGIELAARYVPGSQYGVGGDWYDVFVLPQGGAIGITMGDVMGHGLHAATVMGRVRSALRSYALEDDNPASVLQRLDRKMQHFEPGLIGTVEYGMLEPETGELRISSAGHLPPALTTGNQHAALIDVPIDPPIGVVSGAKRRFGQATVGEDALLCLFTDGVVERRAGDLDEDLGRLCRTLADPSLHTAEGACAEIMSVMLQNREPQDDVSLLVLRRLLGTE
ncbi:MAG TPA: GAF domain-containing SpoIIE family protein phosphatase [Jatrophihabitans sp.]|nr:GAF domain-containing SpoIIE family protein phosphatase [Jatrophihabitans sp.]